MKLSLPYTFLKDLSFSGTSFAILEGRIHTLHEPGKSSNGNYFQNRNQLLVFEEAEEISELEKEIFVEKEKEIENYMSWVIDFKLLRKIADNNSKLKGLGNIYESTKDDSIEKFIMVHVFDIYNHETRIEEKLEINNQKWDDNPILNNNPSTEDLHSKQNSLDILLNNNGVLILGNDCYILNENSDKEMDSFVMFKDKKLYLNPFLSLDQLEDNYTSLLLQRIEKKAFEHGEEYSKILADQKNDLSKLNDMLSTQKNYVNTTEARRGQVGFKKLDNNKYGLFLYIEPFILEKDKKYYAFPTAELGTELKVNSNRMQIVAPLRVLNTPYSHPFVYTNGDICYDGPSRWNRLEINFNHNYDLNSPNSLATKIATVLREARMNIEAGYFGSEVIPLKPIDNFQPIATSLSDAIEYARSNGIKTERIINNN